MLNKTNSRIKLEGKDNFYMVKVELSLPNL